MGEAKRRKQLGLMPTVHPFEVRQQGAELVLISGPKDSALREKIMKGLQDALGERRPWPSVYRREYVMAGMPEKLLRTAADVEAIRVPEHRRLVGELVENYDPNVNANDFSSTLTVINEYQALDEAAAKGSRGMWLHYRNEFSFDGKKWESFPRQKDPFEGLQYLMQHPVTNVLGDLVTEYRHEHHRDGTQTFEPEPTAEHRDKLEELMRDWNGATPEKWDEIYYEGADLPAEEPEGGFPVPTAIRTLIQLRQPAPMPGLGVIAVGSAGDLDIHIPYEERQLTFDGQTWQPYEVGEPDFDDEDLEELGVRD